MSGTKVVSESFVHTKLYYLLMLMQQLMGVTTNAVVFVLLYRMRREYQTLGFGLISVLSVSDFINALHRIPLTLFDMGAFNESTLVLDVVDHMQWFCPLESFLSVFAPYTAALAAMLLSLERYCHVCLRKPLRWGAGWKFLGAGLFFFLIPSLGASIKISYMKQESGRVCFPPLEGWRIVRNHIYYVLLSILLLALTFFYISIYITTKCNIMRCSSGGIKPGSIVRRVALRVFVFLFFYLLCYVPMILAFLMKMNFPEVGLPALGDMTMMTNNLISSIDPILILFLHRCYLHEFILLLNSNRVVRALVGPTAQNYFTTAG
ncbi:hypothetical protein DSO57_1027471 [Entomophthora muscae]|uniref:Uncharacterized protein n=1 Tax=Entomophthora muscae TaxID=34485 RepID=A0ACC2TPA0_9FUNG|nr:hypothetical protein DSO57_1027471 [Entomophthora muscae]